MAYPYQITEDSTPGDWVANPRLGPFVYDTDLVCFLANKTSAFKRIHAYLSLDDGVTWDEWGTLPALIHTPPYTGTYSCMQHGATVWIAYIDPDPPYNLRVASWDLANRWFDAPLAASFAIMRPATAYWDIRILARSDGSLVVVYGSSGGVSYRAHSGGVWGSGNVIAAEGHLLDAVLGDSDRIHIFYWQPTGNHLMHRSVGIGGALGTAQQLDDGSNIKALAIAIHASFYSGLALPYLMSDDTLGVFRASSATDPAWEPFEQASSQDSDGTSTIVAVHVGATLSITWGGSWFTISRVTRSGTWGTVEKLPLDPLHPYTPFVTGIGKYRLVFTAFLDWPPAVWYWEGPAIGPASRYHGR